MKFPHKELQKLYESFVADYEEHKSIFIWFSTEYCVSGSECVIWMTGHKFDDVHAGAFFIW